MIFLSPNRSIRVYGVLLLLFGLFLILDGYHAHQANVLILTGGEDSRPLTGSQAIYLGATAMLMGILTFYLSFRERRLSPAH